MQINEKSRIKLEVDGTTVDTMFHDTNDPWKKAVNRIMQGANKAVIRGVVTIEKIT